ncbi:MAG: exopolysaccharide biosynthesis protein [Pseudomonadota bacterium]
MTQSSIGMSSMAMTSSAHEQEESTTRSTLGAIPLLKTILDDLAREAKGSTATNNGLQPTGTAYAKSADPALEFSEADAQQASGTAAAAAEGAKTTLGALIERLDERAFGLMILFLALPCCLPFVYLLPQIVALPMLALSGQMALGRKSPWLPAKLAGREFQIAGFTSVLERSEKYVGWFEAIAKPRFTVLTGHKGSRIVGLLLMAPCASILVPLPATNTVPGIGVAIASVGLLERDGVLVVLGLIIGFAWIAILLFFGLEAASLFKAWLTARL